MQQHQLREHLPDDRHDSETADMRVGHDREQPGAIAMRRAEPVDQIGKPV